LKSSTCHTIRTLVPGYMDGELSEEQASPLRQHLLSCPTCRNAAQDLGNLSHWFPTPETLAPPAGFAARVARAAFAGEGGQTNKPSAPLRPQVESTPAAPLASEDPQLRRFVLGLTSVAAALLLSLALFMAQEKQPSGEELSAEPIPTALEELDRLNAADSLNRAKGVQEMPTARTLKNR